MQRHRLKKPTSKRKKKQIMGGIIMGVSFVLIVGLLILFLPASNTQNEYLTANDFQSAVPITVDYPAPDIQVTDVEGKPVSLQDYQGKVILLNNWAIWCPPCRAEMPILQAYYEDHKHENFTVIGIESGQESKDVQYHIDLYGLTFPVWLDLKQVSVRAFQNGSLPNSYVIDKVGQVRLTWTGAINQKTLEQYITPLLENK